LAHEVWTRENVGERKMGVYKRIKEFYTKNELLIKRCDEKLTEQIEKVTKEIAERKGKLQDMPPFDEWLAAILNIFK